MASLAALPAKEDITGEPVVDLQQAPAGKWVRTDWVILAALFLTGLALALIVTVQWFDPADDGLYLHQAGIIMRGGVPYRDFMLHDAPLGNAWHALLLSLFGYDALVLRLAVLPFKALMLPAVYALARPLVPRLPALLAALVVPIIDNNTYYTVAHVALNAEALVLVVVLMLAMWIRHPHWLWLAGAGALLGVTTGIKQNMGLYLLAASALWLLDPQPDDARNMDEAESRRVTWVRRVTWTLAVASVLWLVKATPDIWVYVSLVLPVAALALAAIPRRAAGSGALRRLLRRWGALLAGLALTTLPWLAWVVAGAGLSAVWNGLVVVPGGLSAVWFLGLRRPAPEFWWLAGLYLGGIAVAAGLLALGRLARLGRWLAPVVWAGLALWGLGLIFLSPLPGMTSTGLIYTWLYFNLLAFWPLFVMVERLPFCLERSHARLLLVTAVFLALEMYPQLRRINANWCFVLFLPLAAWGLWRAAGALRDLAPEGASMRIKAAPAVAICLLPALAILWTFGWRAAQIYDLPASAQSGRPVPVQWVSLDLPSFHLLESPQNRDYYHRVNDAITSRTRPGEPVYCLYRQIGFYISSGRPPAVGDVYAPPGSTQQEATTIRDEMERAGVRVVLVDNEILDPTGLKDYLLPGRPAPWAIPLRDYLVANFHQVEPLDKWSLWERNN